MSVWAATTNMYLQSGRRKTYTSPARACTHAHTYDTHTHTHTYLHAHIAQKRMLSGIQLYLSKKVRATRNGHARQVTFAWSILFIRCIYTMHLHKWLPLYTIYTIYTMHLHMWLPLYTIHTIYTMHLHMWLPLSKQEVPGCRFKPVSSWLLPGPLQARVTCPSSRRKQTTVHAK